MDPRLRRLLVAATVVLGFLAAFLGGVLFERTVGGERAGDGGSTTGAPDETPRPTGTGQLTIDTGGVPGATTEPPGSPITPRGEVLRVGDQRVVAAPESAPC
ncbi:MAG: hypothetical protein HY658_10415, partial [Actinobacteria bacterium]|nr:hypothetical protein [Actinomycetota bacterium]